MLPNARARTSAAARQDWQLGVPLWRDALKFAAQDAALQSVDQVVERLLATGNYGVGKTKAKALIEMVGSNQSAWLGRDVSLSGFLAKRRKRRTARPLAKEPVRRRVVH